MIVLVLLVVTLFLWLLSMLGAATGNELGTRAYPWLAWFACALLTYSIYGGGARP
jgi:hypothetical protein